MNNEYVRSKFYKLYVDGKEVEKGRHYTRKALVDVLANLMYFSEDFDKKTIEIKVPDNE